MKLSESLNIIHVDKSQCKSMITDESFAWTIGRSKDKSIELLNESKYIFNIKDSMGIFHINAHNLMVDLKGELLEKYNIYSFVSFDHNVKELALTYNDENVIDKSLDEKFCIYIENDTLVIHNRLGYTVWFDYKLEKMQV